jgi:hypothetical protein
MWVCLFDKQNHNLLVSISEIGEQGAALDAHLYFDLENGTEWVWGTSSACSVGENPSLDSPRNRGARLFLLIGGVGCKQVRKGRAYFDTALTYIPPGLKNEARRPATCIRQGSSMRSGDEV